MNQVCTDSDDENIVDFPVTSFPDVQLHSGQGGGPAIGSSSDFYSIISARLSLPDTFTSTCSD